MKVALELHSYSEGQAIQNMETIEGQKFQSLCQGKIVNIFHCPEY